MFLNTFLTAIKQGKTQFTVKWDFTDGVLTLKENIALPSFDSIVTIPTHSSSADLEDLSYFFSNTDFVGEVKFNNLISIGENAAQGLFLNCPKITKALFVKLQSVDQYGLEQAFKNCTNITEISFPLLTTIGNYGLSSTFNNCTNLTTVSFPNLSTISSNGLSYTFNDCTNLTAIHFKTELSGNTECTQNKMKCPTTTSILFDL